jgi:threonylcarbamoyladenosine tRNA methylthiotransferase MtaB
MAKFFIQTFGCRCNQADSAAMRGKLSHGELDEAESHLDADVVVVNTCTVTHRADQQVRQTVRRIRRENATAKLILTGCYAQRDPHSLAALPGVDLVLGNADKERLEDHIDCADVSGGRIIRSPLSPARDFLLPPMSKNGGHTRPFIKLQDGCDSRCSYCIVPAVRGPGRSARPEDALREIRSLVDLGFREIVIAGVHLAAYGRKLEHPVTLVELLERILKIPDLGRLRLSSIEPMRFDRHIVELAALNPAFAHHFHIPLQSGSDRILRRMRRPYRAARFLDLLRYVRATLPRAGLGTDIMVGFPGETDEDFNDSYNLLSESPITYLHVFPFSRREGTDASHLRERVPHQCVQERALALRELSQAKNLAFRKEFLGKRLPAISLSKEEGAGESVALTDNYIHTRIAGTKVPPNRLMDVRIIRAEPDVTIAEIY